MFDILVTMAGQRLDKPSYVSSSLDPWPNERFDNLFAQRSDLDPSLKILTNARDVVSNNNQSLSFQPANPVFDLTSSDLKIKELTKQIIVDTHVTQEVKGKGLSMTNVQGYNGMLTQPPVLPQGAGISSSSTIGIGRTMSQMSPKIPTNFPNEFSSMFSQMSSNKPTIPSPLLGPKIEVIQPANDGASFVNHPSAGFSNTPPLNSTSPPSGGSCGYWDLYQDQAGYITECIATPLASKLYNYVKETAREICPSCVGFGETAYSAVETVKTTGDRIGWKNVAIGCGIGSIGAVCFVAYLFFRRSKVYVTVENHIHNDSRDKTPNSTTKPSSPTKSDEAIIPKWRQAVKTDQYVQDALVKIGRDSEDVSAGYSEFIPEIRTWVNPSDLAFRRIIATCN